MVQDAERGWCCLACDGGAKSSCDEMDGLRSRAKMPVAARASQERLGAEKSLKLGLARAPVLDEMRVGAWLGWER